MMNCSPAVIWATESISVVWALMCTLVTPKTTRFLNTYFHGAVSGQTSPFWSEELPLNFEVAAKVSSASSLLCRRVCYFRTACADDYAIALLRMKHWLVGGDLL